MVWKKNVCRVRRGSLPDASYHTTQALPRIGSSSSNHYVACRCGFLSCPVSALFGELREIFHRKKSNFPFVLVQTLDLGKIDFNIIDFQKKYDGQYAIPLQVMHDTLHLYVVRLIYFLQSHGNRCRGGLSTLHQILAPVKSPTL